MPEINLLPDELRGKEKKEINSASKKLDKVDIAMSNPSKEARIKSSKLKNSRPSILSRLFAQKASTKPAQTITKKQDRHIKANKPMHIPKKEIIVEKKQIEVRKDKNKSSDSKPAVKEDVAIDSKKKKKNTSFKISILGLFRKKSKESKKIIPDALDVNLIPRDLIRYPEVELPKIYAKSGSAIFGTILIVLGGYLAITFYQINVSRQIADIELNISVLDNQINNFASDRKDAVRLQKRIKLVGQLLNNHIYWTDFFKLLEKYTIKDVYYTNFSMAGHDKLIISAIGKDYSAVAKQLVAFNNTDNFIKTVEIEAAVAEINQESNKLIGVSFSATLEFVPNIFFKSTN